MKHTTQVEGLDIDNAELAIKIGDLYYDSLTDLLFALSLKIESDAGNDQARGRTKLARCLHQCAENLKAASVATRKAWDICEPHVIEWEKTHQSNRYRS